MTKARGGFNYFITFTDDHSWYCYVYSMKYKPEAFKQFKETGLKIENPIYYKITVLQSDQKGEYLKWKFLELLKNNGVFSQWTPSGMPQLNSVSRRMNGTLLDMVWSIKSFTKLPLSFWGYAFETTAKLLNIAPSKTVA
ncbi:UNVERIFIED_CONTAM: hypothetical protein Sangu_3192500 [Sesamum angustifolium]|uniref:Integrase catalytic domain-containing protein n=1 Tax=Sesamum angustifolium TaxID=2727405 RepID=A0AAW2JM72_9LAMI